MPVLVRYALGIKWTYNFVSGTGKSLHVQMITQTKKKQKNHYDIFPRTKRWHNTEIYIHGLIN